MKVYVVVDNFCTRCDESIYKVFSSKENAELWIKNVEWLTEHEKGFISVVENDLEDE